MFQNVFSSLCPCWPVQDLQRALSAAGSRECTIEASLSLLPKLCQSHGKTTREDSSAGSGTLALHTNPRAGGEGIGRVEEMRADAVYSTVMRSGALLIQDDNSRLTARRDALEAPTCRRVPIR